MWRPSRPCVSQQPPRGELTQKCFRCPSSLTQGTETAKSVLESDDPSRLSTEWPLDLLARLRGCAKTHGPSFWARRRSFDWFGSRLARHWSLLWLLEPHWISKMRWCGVMLLFVSVACASPLVPHLRHPVRSERGARVREAFLHAWRGYELHAFGHDEVCVWGLVVAIRKCLTGCASGAGSG